MNNNFLILNLEIYVDYNILKLYNEENDIIYENYKEFEQYYNEWRIIFYTSNVL